MASDTWDIQKIDMGIALCHFELGASESGLRAVLNLEDPGIPVQDGLVYIASSGSNKQRFKQNSRYVKALDGTFIARNVQTAALLLHSACCMVRCLPAHFGGEGRRGMPRVHLARYRK